MKVTVKSVWVKCKDCSLERNCPVFGSKRRALGKKRLCDVYFGKPKKASSIPVRRWLWDWKKKELIAEFAKKQAEEARLKKIAEEQKAVDTEKMLKPIPKVGFIKRLLHRILCLLRLS